MRTAELSAKQLEVLRLISYGLTDEQIGKQTFRSSRTVGTQIRELRWKLGAENRAHAVRIGFEKGLLNAEP